MKTILAPFTKAITTEMQRKVLPKLPGISDSSAQSCSTMDTGPVCRRVCLFTPQLTPVPYYTAWWQKHICFVINLSEVALDSATAGAETAISNRKSNTPATTPLSHLQNEWREKFRDDARTTQRMLRQPTWSLSSWLL